MQENNEAPSVEIPPQPAEYFVHGHDTILAEFASLGEARAYQRTIDAPYSSRVYRRVNFTLDWSLRPLVDWVWDAVRVPNEEQA